MSQVVRVVKEYFLPDSDLKRALGLPSTVVVLQVERKIGTYKGRGRGDQTIDLTGTLVTVYDPHDA